MGVESVYEYLSASLNEYLETFGMSVGEGPLRAARELVHGIVFTCSVQLTNAVRLVARTPAELAHMVNRMSQHLADPHWDHTPWAQAILQEQVRHIQDDDLIAIDSTELAKPYAEHMEYLCIVRDASRRDHPLVPGYWCHGAYHWQPQARILSPLMLCPYSTHQPEFRSENVVWRQRLGQLRQATGGRGIWLEDRGADRPEILSAFLTFQDRWIIRLREDRALIGPDKSLRSAGYWADWALANRPERGHAVSLPVQLPPEAVRQTLPYARLWLVVPTYTFGQNERWVLLTRGLIHEHSGHSEHRRVRHGYGGRWRAEDGKRSLGQLWHVERFLTRSFLALERMLWCVVLAGGFVGMLQRDEPKLAAELEQEVLYWDKPPILPGYRLARGIQTIAQHDGPAMLAVNA